MLILNVDDDSDDRELFFEALKALNSQISCIQLESGLQAIEFLEKPTTLPDYLFIDINMPKMNGYACVKELMQIPRMKHIQIIILSTSFALKDEVYFSRLGIKHLLNGYRFSDLVDAIESALPLQFRPLERKSEKRHPYYFPLRAFA